MKSLDSSNKIGLMGKRLIRFLITSSFALAIIMPATGQRTIYVSPAGSDLAAGTLNSPYRTIQYAVSKSLANDIIYLRGGSYRESVTIPGSKTGLKIYAYVAEIPVIKGSIVTSSWLPNKSYWKKFVDIQPQQVMINGDNPLQQIGYPNDDFRQNQSYPRYKFPVGTGLNDMAAGRFFWQNDTLYIMLKDKSDPNIATVEVSQQRYLMRIEASGVHIKGIHFRHTNSNTFGEFGAAVELGDNSLIEDCDVQWCDFGGISMGYYKTGARVLRCNASNNGCTGINASCSFNFHISESKANYNNNRNFYSQWHAGGFKGASASWGTIEKSEFAFNTGAGIWFDYCFANTKYRQDGPKPLVIRDNHIHDNSKSTNKNSALMIEVSEQAFLQNNLVINNDYRGIYISASWDCKIFNNVVAYTQLHHAIDIHGMPRSGARLTNNYVANNILYNNNTADDIEIYAENGNDVKNNISDYNLIYRDSGPIKLRYGAITYTSLDEWKRNIPFTDRSITGNPDFRDEMFHISSKSPAVDAGSGSIPGLPEKDYDGNARLTGSRVDIGAHEYYSVPTKLEKELKLNSSVKVYPNPASDFFCILIPGNEIYPDRIALSDLAGKLIMKKNIERIEGEIRVPINIVRGIYILQILCGKETVHTQKLLIH